MRLFLYKILQRRLYDLCSSKQSLLLCFSFFCMTLIAILHIFEEFPIDAVYTWVNGTDPQLLTQLYKTREEIQKSIQREFERNSNDECLRQSHITCESSDEHNCLETPIVFISPQITNPHNLFDNVTKFQMIDTRATLIYFSTVEEAREIAFRCFVTYNSSTYSLRRTHIIEDQLRTNVDAVTDSQNHKNSEKGVKFSSDSLILVCCTALNVTNGSQLLRYLSPFVRKQVNPINIYADKHCALFDIKNPIVNSTKIIQSMRMALQKRLTDCQSLTIRHPIDLTVYGSHNTLSDLKTERLQDLSESRFADNQELKYSLRSLERNANWIRNVFIVTNGQIPNWLNLDNPRVKIITHEEIFTNKSHLPSFSSPAIETHLHRIPGLSKRFLYLNDDILIGKPIYPDDFYTKSKGFKVYLSWPVPNCAEGCPMNWLKDGYCDQACNSSECLWDGGDCDVDKQNQNSRPHDSRQSFLNTYTDSPVKYSDGYCSANCVDSWLSDKFCDQVCNNIDCAFDLGDCGVDNFKLIDGIEFHPKRHIYYLRSDSKAIYFDFNKFFVSNIKNKINLEINEVSYENNSFVRSSALHMNHRVLVFLFLPNHEKQDLNITLKGIKNNSQFVIEFQALVNNDLKLNTSYDSIDERDFNERQELSERENNWTKTHIYSNKTYEKISKSDFKSNHRFKAYPKILTQNELEFNESLECEFNIEELPNELKSRFNQIDLKFKNQLLTEKGLKNFKRRLIQLYVKQICNYEKTLKTFDTTISAFDWERHKTFAEIEKSIAREGETDLRRSDNRVIRRHLMDSYADSLRHVNHLYNQVFGIEMRKVPPHMAHFIDTDVMTRLQRTFTKHFDITSSHRIRSSDDMQFAFAYNYYLMSELNSTNVSQIFDEFDVDGSGTWSSREVRKVILNVYELPLSLENFQEFYGSIFWCCSHSSEDLCKGLDINANVSQLFQRDIDYQMKFEVQKSLVIDCLNVSQRLSQLFSNQKHNNYEIVGEDDVSFKMIRTNATVVAQELDQLNKEMKKFICLNDNIDHKSSDDRDVMAVKRLLVDFYESLFPIESEFELPFGQRNRFTNIWEINEINNKLNENNRNINKLLLILIIFIIIIAIICHYFVIKC